MEIPLIKYIESTYSVEKQCYSFLPDFQVEIIKDAKIGIFEGKYAQFRIDAKGIGRISNFSPVKICYLNGKLFWSPIHEELECEFILSNYVNLRFGKWENIAPRKTKYKTEKIEIENRTIEIKSWIYKNFDGMICSIDDQYYILDKQLFDQSYPNLFDRLHPFNKEKVLGAYFNEQITIEEEDHEFIQLLENAPDSNLPWFDKDIIDCHPRYQSNFYLLRRHVKILPNYRIFIGLYILLNNGCMCPKCSASDFIKKTVIFFRIQKGKVSKTSERVISIRFQHFNHSMNYMLSKCLVKKPEIYEDIETIIKDINVFSGLAKIDDIESSKSSYMLKNTCLIVENSFDLDDVLLSCENNLNDVRLFYKLDQFGNFWISTSDQFEIWLKGSKSQEEGTFLLKVYTKIKSEIFEKSDYLKKANELKPEIKIVTKIELVEFSSFNITQKDHKESLALKKIQKLIEDKADKNLFISPG